jgi:hypothetical protein
VPRKPIGSDGSTLRGYRLSRKRASRAPALTRLAEKPTLAGENACYVIGLAVLRSTVAFVGVRLGTALSR